MMLVRLFFLMIVCVMPMAARAQDNAAMVLASPDQAVTFVNKMGEGVLTLLSDKSISNEQVQSGFRTLLIDNFDLKTISRFALGRYWNRATPEQREEYQQLFEQMVVSIYNDRFRNFKTGVGFQALRGRAAEGQDFIVESQITIPEAPAVLIDWRVRQKGDNRFQVVDVVVEGVSMGVTQRSEFASIIQRGGDQVEVLLQSLRDRLAAKKQAAPVPVSTKP